MSHNGDVAPRYEPAAPILKVVDLVAGYGAREVIRSVDFELRAGEIVALIGHNGAGKSTLLKALFGLIPASARSVEFEGRGVRLGDSMELRRHRVSFAPQGNRVFGDLSVFENLELGGLVLRDRSVIRKRVLRVLEVFPGLVDRGSQLASTLSGGEKQMLALATALITAPKLLLLDEPSLGLAPHSVTSALQRIRQINREEGVSMLIVEQKVREVLTIADSVIALRNGRISFDGAAAELRDDRKLRDVYL